MPEAIPVSFTAVTLAVGLAAGLLFGKRPCVIIEPAGLTIRRLRRRREINWDELAPGGPLPPTRGGTSQITLYRKPPRPGTGPLAEKLPIGWLHHYAHFDHHGVPDVPIAVDSGVTRYRSAGSSVAILVTASTADGERSRSAAPSQCVFGGGGLLPVCRSVGGVSAARDDAGSLGSIRRTCWNTPV